MAATPKFSPVQDAIKMGLEKLKKWYRSTDDTDAYFICLGKILDCFCIYTLISIFYSLGSLH